MYNFILFSVLYVLLFYNDMSVLCFNKVVVLILIITYKDYTNSSPYITCTRGRTLISKSAFHVTGFKTLLSKGFI